MAIISHQTYVPFHGKYPCPVANGLLSSVMSTGRLLITASRGSTTFRQPRQYKKTNVWDVGPRRS